MKTICVCVSYEPVYRFESRIASFRLPDHTGSIYRTGCVFFIDPDVDQSEREEVAGVRYGPIVLPRHFRSGPNRPLRSPDRFVGVHACANMHVRRYNEGINMTVTIVYVTRGRMEGARGRKEGDENLKNNGYFDPPSIKRGRRAPKAA